MKDLQSCTITIGTCMYKEYMCEIGNEPSQGKRNVLGQSSSRRARTETRELILCGGEVFIFLAVYGCLSKFIIYLTWLMMSLSLCVFLVIVCSRYILEGRVMIDGWH